MKLIEYKGEKYPQFQSTGFASRFAFPFAKEFCQGKGYDIGCNRKEWAYEGATPIDLIFPEDIYNANCLPADKVDYIFSSHCLEHLENWVLVLDYWMEKVKKGGVIFLYLPDYSQVYWRPWNNHKHLNILSAEMLKDYFEDAGCKEVLVSGVDLNNSFYVVAQI